MSSKLYLQYIKNIILVTFKDKKILFDFYIILIALFCGIGANMYMPYSLKIAIDSFKLDRAASVLYILLGYGIIWTMSQILLYIRSYLTSKIEHRITYILSVEVLCNIFNFSYSYFTHHKPGELTNLIRRAQQDVPKIILGIFFYTLPTLIEFLSVIYLIYKLYPVLYSLLMFCILSSLFIYNFILMKFAFKTRDIANRIDKNVDGLIADWILNYESIKIFDILKLALKNCGKELQKREKAELNYIWRYHIVRIGQAFLLGACIFLLTYLVGKGVQTGELQISDFILFNGYLLQFIIPVNILSHAFQDVKKAIIDTKEILKIVTAEKDINNAINPIFLKGDRFKLKLDRVSFNYEERQILKNFSLELDQGESLILRGKTGSGKSTIAKLIMRLYTPSSGGIFINDINIKDISFKSLYKIIGYVSQENYFLNDTIQNNLLLAYPNASLKDIEKALDEANLLDFVNSLPNKIQTIIGSKGIMLSGGEKQRLCLCRLLLKKPNICIFDESTSFLDPKTEKIIEDNIVKFHPNMTKIIITHSSKFMNVNADSIITLNDNNSNKQ